MRVWINHLNLKVRTFRNISEKHQETILILLFVKDISLWLLLFINDMWKQKLDVNTEVPCNSKKRKTVDYTLEDLDKMSGGFF